MIDTATPNAFADDVRQGLTREQKALSPKYLYDTLGSTLFEAITQLPEYGLWRAEQEIFATHADEIAAQIEATQIVELGSGSANKTIHILNVLLQRGALNYYAIDLSPLAIELTCGALSSIDRLTVRGVQAEYLNGLKSILSNRASDTKVLILFLGSSLGNFNRDAGLRFLQDIRALLHPGDAVLLGTDLIKPLDRMLAAYDDALGVTAAFNLNLLVRMNRELGSNFLLPQFRHVARFNERNSNVEMHIESLCAQQVQFNKADFSISFRSGETIHTESSHKYSLQELESLASASGFRNVAQWLNDTWPFASTLYRAE